MIKPVLLFCCICAIFIHIDLSYPVNLDGNASRKSESVVTGGGKVESEKAKAAREDREKRERVRKLARKVR